MNYFYSVLLFLLLQNHAMAGSDSFFDEFSKGTWCGFGMSTQLDATPGFTYKFQIDISENQTFHKYFDYSFPGAPEKSEIEINYKKVDKNQFKFIAKYLTLGRTHTGFARKQQWVNGVLDVEMDQGSLSYRAQQTRISEVKKTVVGKKYFKTGEVHSEIFEIHQKSPIAGDCSFLF